MADPYVDAQNGAVALATRDLNTYWSRLDHTDPMRVRLAMEEFWPTLLGQYGEMTAALAADQFEKVTGLGAHMVRPVDPERANARMRWAMGPAFDGDPSRSLARMEGLTDELVKQPGRSTYTRSASDHGLKYARVPVGKTCPWCKMLGSRGYVYHSEGTAGHLNRFHGHCDCRIVVEGDKVEGYEPDELYHMYSLARREAGSGKADAIIAAWRRLDAEGRMPVYSVEKAAQEAAVAAEKAAQAAAQTQAEANARQAELDRHAEEAAAAADQSWRQPTNLDDLEKGFVYDSLQEEEWTEWSDAEIQDTLEGARDMGDEAAVYLLEQELESRYAEQSGYRGTGFTRDQLRKQFTEWVEGEYWRAEAETNGHMLTPAGIAKGISPRDLFTANESTAMKYASTDLKYYWMNRPRLTFDAWVGDGDARGRAGKMEF